MCVSVCVCTVCMYVCFKFLLKRVAVGYPQLSHLIYTTTFSYIQFKKVATLTYTPG